MDMQLLSKKLSSYRTTKGRITRVPDELAYEILLAWEEWSGPASGFYRELGADHRKMASIIGRAKKLKRDGVFIDSQFKEIKIADAPETTSIKSCAGGISLKWSPGRVIRFSMVDQLIEFLDKTKKSDQEAA